MIAERMSRDEPATIEKHCLYCGGSFLVNQYLFERKAFCGKSCASKKRYDYVADSKKQERIKNGWPEWLAGLHNSKTVEDIAQACIDGRFSDKQSLIDELLEIEQYTRRIIRSKAKWKGFVVINCLGISRPEQARIMLEKLGYKGEYLTDSTIQERNCKLCGSEFAPKLDRQVYCSNKCRKALDGGSVSRRARRILKKVYGLRWNEHYEYVRASDVHDRSGWRCQLCGCKVKRYKSFNWKQATVDHIVPLSVGGDHKMANLQTACMKCNTDKGAETRGQLCLDL